MIIGSVFKALLVLCLSSQYKLWISAKPNDGLARFTSPDYHKLLNDNVRDVIDSLDTWLYGPIVKVPMYGYDDLQTWLYGPNHTQKAAAQNPLKSETPKQQPKHHHGSHHAHLSGHERKWIHGPEHDYQIVSSDNEGNVFMDP